jgi:hypothetical protein
MTALPTDRKAKQSGNKLFKAPNLKTSLLNPDTESRQDQYNQGGRPGKINKISQDATSVSTLNQEITPSHLERLRSNQKVLTVDTIGSNKMSTAEERSYATRFSPAKKPDLKKRFLPFRNAAGDLDDEKMKEYFVMQDRQARA